MLKVDTITKDWKEAGSFPAQLNLYGFWDEHCFLTKAGDLGAVLKIGGLDYESLDHAGRDYAVKRLEAALRSLDDKTRLYQILFKRNHPEIPHAEYENPLVRAAVEQRAAFLQSKSDRLYSIEIFWVVTWAPRMKDIYRDHWRNFLSDSQIDKAFVLSPPLAIVSYLCGRDPAFTSPHRSKDFVQSYVRSLARHMDRCAQSPEFMEVLCR
jgi:type IV secretory pathway VirB4 component